MVKFTIYFERISPRSICDCTVNLNTNRCECKGSIILTNVFAKGIRIWAYATEKVFESCKGEGMEGDQLDPEDSIDQIFCY